MTTEATDAIVTSPAPDRSAPPAASASAPDMPADPATTMAVPTLRLWASSGRRPRTRATSASSGTPITSGNCGVGMPMSTTTTSPACSLPGWKTMPSLRAAMVTVVVARMAGPSTLPVSPSTPEGMSTATTGRPDRLTASTTWAAGPARAPRNPVP